MASEGAENRSENCSLQNTVKNGEDDILSQKELISGSTGGELGFNDIHSANTDDAELDDLLDNALEDFDSISTSCQCPEINQSSQLTNIPLPHVPATSSTSADSSHTSSSNQSQDAMFSKLFNDISSSQQHQPDAKSMEEILLSMMSGDPNKLNQQFPGLDFDLDSAELPAGDIAETLQQTLGSLAQNMQDLKSDNISEEEIMRMMSNIGMEGGDGNGEEDFLPMMQGMMKNLLSKDVLYPSLKEISSQYPKWFEENEDKVDKKDFDKYKKQHELMKQIIEEYDSETETDDKNMKQKRFERILDVMQQMQELGQPPKEIIGDLPKDLEVDENGLPKIPAGLFPSGVFPNSEQCSVM